MNRYSNAEGSNPYGTWHKPKSTIKGTTVNPIFDGIETCDELELSNFSSLDSNLKDKFIASPNIISYRVPNRQVKNDIVLGRKGGRPMGRESFDGTSNKSAPKLDYSADGDNADLSKEDKPEINAIKADTKVAKDETFLWMPKKIGITVSLLGAAAIIFGGYKLFIKLKK